MKNIELELVMAAKDVLGEMGGGSGAINRFAGGAGLVTGPTAGPIGVRSRQTPFERLASNSLRLAVVVIYLVFGLQKFTLVEAQGIAPLISNSPLTSWLGVMGVQGASRFVGIFELTFGALLAYGFWRPASLPALAGAAGSCICFLTTLSFLLTTPGVFAPNAAPILSGDTGLFLLKDIVTLAASIVFLAQGLALRGAAVGRSVSANAMTV